MFTEFEWNFLETKNKNLIGGLEYKRFILDNDILNTLLYETGDLFKRFVLVDPKTDKVIPFDNHKMRAGHIKKENLNDFVCNLKEFIVIRNEIVTEYIPKLKDIVHIYLSI